MSDRKYLPTLSDLVDRLSIVQLKAIRIPGRHQEYMDEIKLIEHDIDLILGGKFNDNGWHLSASDVRAIMIVMLTNSFIWDNEAKARDGGSEQDKLLKLTHSINGIRNTAKNKLAQSMGERLDFKIDCFAAELEEEFGNWRVFE